MLIKEWIKTYIDICYDINGFPFQNEYLLLVLFIILAIPILLLDIILSPIEIIGLIVGKIIKKVEGRRWKK